jgi:hypothetical protein
MRRAVLALVACSFLPGCLGTDEEQVPGKTDPDSTHGTGPAVAARCEALGPGPDWRRKGVAAGRFGLLATDLGRARELSNGNFLAKVGAVVEGHAPVTVRVPEASRGRVGLVYGDASRGRGRRLSKAPAEVTFTPCPNRQRSGYVGGLLLETVSEPVTLEVRLPRAGVKLLTIGSNET